MLWLIGTGPMASAYADVLKRLGVNFAAVGRDTGRTAAFGEKHGIAAAAGGVAGALARLPPPRHAIVAVGVDMLAPVTLDLLRAGCREILVEKPGGLTGEEAAAVSAEALSRGADVRIAYNRRFYASVREAAAMIAASGPALSAVAEFDEPVPRIEELATPAPIKAKWGFANASHVLDLMAYLCGEPDTLAARVGGPTVAWHPSGSVFTGHGATASGASFVYHGNYASVGRWRLTVSIPGRRLIFCPMEALKVVEGRSVEEKERAAEPQDGLKPGLLGQVEAFLGAAKTDLPDIALQAKRMAPDGWLARIFGYDGRS